ncbi:MAG: 3-phosphoshikimate 1-carboxyvinyltransferase [Chloroflexi bacterium]|nr:MAG: 3-phosphoshikimate 1-carboxyvinyltransferase [Chloroflexota bacterium]
MRLIVTPGNPLRGSARVPGDKSLSHRALLFGALASGESRIGNFLVSGVTKVMLDALAALGVDWTLDENILRVKGKGFAGLRSPNTALNCGNSATTIRMMAGALAAAGIEAVLDGSPGLRRRPMERIVEPLRCMGVPVEASEGGTAPLRLGARPTGKKLSAAVLDLPVSSAQVKTCLLLAALAADGETVLYEPGPSRDHTERMLRSMGVEVESRIVEWGGRVLYETHIMPLETALKPVEMNLPGDISAAAFLIVAATITPGSDISIAGVSINPTRTGIVDALRGMGAEIEIVETGQQAGEPVGDLRVRYAQLVGGRVDGALVVRMIDEFSVFGSAAACAEGDSIVRDASELRYKESDRIHTLCEELGRLGVVTEEADDGFTIHGGTPGGGTVQSHGDHRLAMAMTVAGLAARAPVIVEGAEIIDESFPAFMETLCRLGANISVEEDNPV